jgi:hypothetical protein
MWVKKGSGIDMKKMHHPPFIFSDSEIRYQYLQNEPLINVRKNCHVIRLVPKVIFLGKVKSSHDFDFF